MYPYSIFERGSYIGTFGSKYLLHMGTWSLWVWGYLKESRGVCVSGGLGSGLGLIDFPVFSRMGFRLYPHPLSRNLNIKLNQPKPRT